ncbi:hypothetical protein QX249_12315 [Vibrio parahaemolyticus]|uniref:Uncharacterized protein n=1 Tax=Vibrio parahaemolyticus TaxID=670 RepID=A0AAW8PZ08_VIBPH|nr:hypothetical protein [Vibrio parahaemolyticus]MDS1821447.1 hypothetical protein [Vibrio parahaemolyticus]
MKQLSFVALMLCSLPAYSLSCIRPTIDDFIQNDFVYIGTLKSKETPPIGDDIKNEMEIQNIIKGSPDSNLVYTHSLNGRFADYSSFAQIEGGEKYLISGNYGEKLVFGLCGHNVRLIDGEPINKLSDISKYFY